MATYIITDSGTDLPPEIVEEYKLKIVPLKLYLDDVEYTDGLDITPKEVFDKMRTGAMTRTAQVTTQEFVKAFEEYAKEGLSLIYIAFSGVLSGTVNAAYVAKNDLLERYPDFDITIIDTKCASLGHGMVVLRALEMLKNGAPKEEIIEAVKFHAQHMQHIFTVDDLEYLYRGGRVTRTSAFIGRLLSIKPVLHVDGEGKLSPIAKVKGRQSSLRKIAEIACERGVNLDKQIIAISHGDDMEAVEVVKGFLKEMAGCEKFLVSYVGAMIGAHSGPGTLAVFFLDCESPYEKYFGGQ
ncbi:MAG: DegV family protein [Clostridiaceae bacterium]|jgi:DegV family protein with EDD domain|nr:DegV family protein [Clostridiaceae bacterium]